MGRMALIQSTKVNVPCHKNCLCLSLTPVRRFTSQITSCLLHSGITIHTVSHVTLLVSSGKFMGGSAFFLSPPENKKAKFAFCTLKRKGGSTQKQPFLTVRFRGALLTKSVTLEFSQDTVCIGTNQKPFFFIHFCKERYVFVMCFALLDISNKCWRLEIMLPLQWFVEKLSSIRFFLYFEKELK